MTWKIFKPKNSVIEFKCHEEDWNVIPKPFPSRKFLPKWYKSLVPKVSKGFEGSTVKRCPPFLDAMTAGWIIPLVADVEFTANSDASGVNYKWNFYRTMIENHKPDQIENHPTNPKPPMKFLNYWKIKVPRGWSVLFTEPFNRADDRFTCMTGIVECDLYDEFINFPFIWHKKNYVGILPAGTPLVQVIPIKRECFEIESDFGILTQKDLSDMDLTRKKRQVHESHYRDQLWVKKGP